MIKRQEAAMEGFNGNPGINKLANVLSQRMKAENRSPLILDFGEIQGDGRFPKGSIRCAGMSAGCRLR